MKKLILRHSKVIIVNSIKFSRKYFGKNNRLFYTTLPEVNLCKGSNDDDGDAVSGVKENVAKQLHQLWYKK